ncbi:lipoamide acyltransferase component of branched-chain alpha-keto acid dehydrogenase complex, mitochondrial [Cornus florida]|uniref:lipoamide acyltransferase component of branched-chain alpha-keto acid dehydrogenase complex, mitochondrial n=1 Tax=Cornus florida TaxID=4283 RepID=UPI0028A288C8|nr:lipoamide acyltransferase component of branched-chain alpha-keto acid dehydrogenase complex, mitochondrial [Cornus florida]XP_059647709.1 lipoamide acyltransferase component of branched-chain alpha-keto acid dehydrogenase complex, mitochondrial [Cornus florida]
MIFRRVSQQKKLWNSGRGWRWHSCSSSTPPHTAAVYQLKPPLLGFRNQSSASFSSTYKHNDFPYGTMIRCFSSHASVNLPVGKIIDVPLAQTGEGIAECELLKWFVQEGDQVEEFQPLCEVQSDKATIEITSRYEGKVSQILHVPGDIVKVEETLLKIFVNESPVPTEIYGSLDNKSLGSEICDSSSQTNPVPNKTNNLGVLSTPAVRNLAKEYNINISDVCGTGKDGRILREDVLKYAVHKGIMKETSASLSATSVEQLLGGEEEYSNASAAEGWHYEDKTVQLRGFQRTMVKSMTLAAKIPHFYYVEEINCDTLVELKASFQSENSDPDVKYTFLPILIKSLSVALSKYPLLNSCFNEELHEVTLKGSHNIGIAMATPSGLVVPNIKKVQSLSFLEITKELSRLQQLALANKLSPEDISGGTITLSNIGAIGGKFGSPLLNIPEVSIIAIGRIQKVPQFANDGNVYPASVMSVNIGADHRVLDGATVARFCNEWKLFIEKPELLMLHMK